MFVHNCKTTLQVSVVFSNSTFCTADLITPSFSGCRLIDLDHDFKKKLYFPFRPKYPLNMGAKVSSILFCLPNTLPRPSLSLFHFIDTVKKAYPLCLLCEVMQVSRSGFYSWEKRDKSARDQKLIKDYGIRSCMSTGKRRLLEGDCWERAACPWGIMLSLRASLVH